jgi:hypothetical protein
MLDTKGPEIRTAMLKGGQDIQLTAGVCKRTASTAERALWASWASQARPRAAARVGCCLSSCSAPCAPATPLHAARPRTLCLTGAWCRPAGQEVVVHAVGAAYTSWEGCVEEGSGRALIGLSYDKLCRDVKPGGRILLADGSITIKARWRWLVGCLGRARVGGRAFFLGGGGCPLCICRPQRLRPCCSAMHCSAKPYAHTHR